jgi:hypothetical protein
MLLSSKKGISCDALIVNNMSLFVWFVVFDATFNNISGISWRVPDENHRPVASH